jgi:two-component sensor histidine kinase/CheY-like chemotaxis protein
MTPPERDPRKGRILIIDDDPASLKMLTAVLTEGGYTVHPADDGELGLRFVKHTPPDLILLDVRMPGMDGYQVCASLKNDTPGIGIPVIFLSSMDRAIDKVKAFRSGAVDYIVKPFEAEEVLARIETHLSLRHLREHLECEVRERTKQLQASLAEKEALLKEVHHRVKNNLQLISSLLSLQAARVENPAVAELFAESRSRVLSMALVHENLYRAGNFASVPMAAHIRGLCAYLTGAYILGSQRVELAIQVGDVHLDLDRAICCGLIINELVSNALKHAFPDGRAGRVLVELRVAEGKRYVLVVSDNGIGLPIFHDDRRGNSLGLQLVDDLTEQLHGSIAVSRDGGTTFTITFGADGRAERESCHR